ncbi:sucrose nonfermenting 4-like protein isoform X1 [Amaranthus tricolor]|uniref:sucrose nonfermenting 4-like protein isoform X1 n=2 Tax=Amaranthus tricolor TaxID=29722 RepID=UPI00258472A4|nr:sucrose nonfermenting 4-like protein isoform X1 [Amaranthus tricolor]
MFGSNPDSGTHTNSGLPGNIFFPTRFVWPHGGRRVFLSGSFTGWTEHILMSPMEGTPTAFQVICNLTPGYHQYKFNVDGEWRYDEHQPFVSGAYGVVNNVRIPRESDIGSVMFNSDTPGRSNMEVDENTFVRPMASPDGMLRERISEADVQISRHRISLFLSQHTAYELLPESGKVVALDVTLPVKQAFHILYEQGVPAAPLWDFGKGHFVGVLSAIDFILILRELGNHGSNLTEEELETHTILAWKDGKVCHNRQTEGSGRPYARQLINAGPYDSLKDVAMKILQNRVSTVPIINSSSPDGSFPQLLHLASLSGILKCICRHFKHSSSSLPILQQPICSIPLGTWVPKIGESSRPPFAMLRQNATLAAALSLLVQADVSSVPIVDDSDSLLDIYSRSDITSLAKDRAYAQIRLDEMNIHQALQLGQDANSPCGVFNGQRCQMCLSSDPLHKIMERLSNPGVRRLVIVEAGSKRVQGIITLSDVFRFLLG